MRALRQRMDARIGPPGAMHSHALGANPLKRAFQVILNRIAVRLALPSGKWRTVVGNDQLEPRRHLIALEDSSRSGPRSRALCNPSRYPCKIICAAT